MMEKASTFSLLDGYANFHRLPDIFFDTIDWIISALNLSIDIQQLLDMKIFLFWCLIV